MDTDRTIYTDGGDYREINNRGTYVEGNYYNLPQEKKNLSETFSEIQQLFQQLEQIYDIDTTFGKIKIATESIKYIEKNPSQMARILSALKTGSISAVEQALNHPAATFFIAAMQDWQQTNPASIHNIDENL